MYKNKSGIQDPDIEQMKKNYRDYEKATDSEKGSILRNMAQLVDNKPFLYDYVPRVVKNDLSAGNEFYKEIDRITFLNKDTVEQNGSRVYTENEINQMEIYKNLTEYRVNAQKAEKDRLQREAAQRREVTKQKADLLRPEFQKNMLDLNQKWNNLYAKRALSGVMNIALSTKMVNVIKVVPDTYDIVPGQIKNSPGLDIAKPFYDASREHLKRNAQDISDIMMDPKDSRRASVAKLITDTNRDQVLRDDPKRAMEYHRLLMEKEGKKPQSSLAPKINNKENLDDLLKPANEPTKKESTQKKVSPKNIFDEMSR